VGSDLARYERDKRLIQILYSKIQGRDVGSNSLAEK